MPNHAWSFHQIPLAGDTLWVRTQDGTPSLSHIDQLEIHQDTWDAGFTMYYDGVGFMTLSPPRLTHVRLDAGGRATFELVGLAGRQYILEAADDLSGWAPLTTVTATNTFTSTSTVTLTPTPPRAHSGSTVWLSSEISFDPATGFIKFPGGAKKFYHPL